MDSLSTIRYTTLNLKIDVGTPGERAGIHWHIAEENEVRYASVDDKREDMIWVEVRQNDGSYKRYTNQRIPADRRHAGDYRIVDCVDCHNRATHIYENPENAVEEKIRLGYLDKDLPYIKRTALESISKNYANRQAAMNGIENQFRSFYRRGYPELFRAKMTSIDAAVTVLKDLYTYNIHHYMNIEWGTYPSHIGHKGRSGCFRCHNAFMIDDDGSSITNGCTVCHSILAYGADEPFHYITEGSEEDPDYQMHEYLRREMLESSR
jgi:hypothetical protein